MIVIVTLALAGIVIMIAIFFPCEDKGVKKLASPASTDEAQRIKEENNYSKKK